MPSHLFHCLGLSIDPRVRELYSRGWTSTSLRLLPVVFHVVTSIASDRHHGGSRAPLPFVLCLCPRDGRLL